MPSSCLSPREDATDTDSVSERALAAGPGENRLRQRRNLQDSHAECGNDCKGLKPVDSVLGLSDHRRKRGHIPEYELLEDHQERDRYDGNKGILNERA